MKIYIDTYTSPTGKRMLDVGGFTRWEETHRPQPKDVVLKWGRGIGGYPHGIRILNPTICSDKLYQGQAIAQAGVPIPKIYTNEEEWVRDGYPDLVKKPREGEGGRGIVLCQKNTNRPGWRYENIYMQYIDKIKEFRAMQIGNLTAYIMEKFPPEGSNPLCWNLHQGAKWQRVSSSQRVLCRDINILATKTLAAIHYDIGGVDLMVGRDGHMYILECNSRPGIGPENMVLFVNTLKMYCDNL
jgi:glutathione synthase/RimK-type ligase-like ATP-grasp enzyme